MFFFPVLLLFAPLSAEVGLNPVEKEFAQFLENHKRENPGKAYEERTLEELREGTSVLLQYAGDAAPVSFLDDQIPSRDGHLIPIRIYNHHLAGNLPTLIFYPGCAFVFDLAAINNIIASRIAAFADSVRVIVVHYRLIPEHPFPINFHDCYDAAAFIAAHSEQFGVDRNYFLLAGWCTGAHCATAISSMARESNAFRVHHQILVSGSFDLTESTHEFDWEEKEDKTVDRNLLRHLKKTYYNLSEMDFTNPLFSPSYERNFHDFPPTTILCGQYDALRNDSEGYFCKLKAGGVAVQKIILPGQTHNTILMRTVLSDGIDPAELIADIAKKFCQ